MAKFSLYNIPLKNLSQGKHTYEYELDRKFFEAIDGDEVKKGNVKVMLTIKKTSSTYEFNFDLKGLVQVPCNRCLDDLDQEIDSQNRLIVKLGKEYSEESDEVVIIPEDEGEINIGISVVKGNSSLLDAMNAVLSEMTVEDMNQIMNDAIAVQPAI